MRIVPVTERGPDMFMLPYIQTLIILTESLGCCKIMVLFLSLCSQRSRRFN